MREAFNKQDWGLRQAGKAGGVWRSSVDYSNNRKSAGHEKWQCLEDYDRKFVAQSAGALEYTDCISAEE